MKKLFSLFLIFVSLNNVQGQSFLKVRNNIFKFGIDSSQYKLGFGVGHERILIDKSVIKILFGQDLDYKRGTFNYYDGGVESGKLVFGNINFLNAQLNAKIRMGKEFFFETGLYSSVSLIKKITNGGTVTTTRCLLPINQAQACPPPVGGEINDESNDFGSIDFGGLLGIGYTYMDYKIILDGQFGLKSIVNLPYSQLTTIQFNLNAIIPFEKFKRKGKNSVQ